MKFDQAIIIAKDCARAKRIAGLLADVPYSQPQLCDVIATLMDQIVALEEAVTLANRRYAAANARNAKVDKAA